MDEDRIASWAVRLLAAFDHATPLEPLTTLHPELSEAEAYAIAAEILRLRTERGETPIGWKIGFTNRTIWDEYGVRAPIWGPMYASTTSMAASAENGSDPSGDRPVSRLHEPQIEAEIAFRLSRTPPAEADEAELLACVDAVCHGFEIVQCPFPGWRFRPVDTMAAGALHAGFVHGPWTRIAEADRGFWRSALRDFSITLYRDGDLVDRGDAENVLGGPLSALRHFVSGLAAQPHGRILHPGDIVTTGTVPRAFPVSVGQRWSTSIEGLPLSGLVVSCR